MMFRASLSAASLFLLWSAGMAQVSIQPAPPRTPSDTVYPNRLPPPAANDTLYMQSKIASFKIVPKGPELPNGRLEFSFSGTVLVSGLVPGTTLKTTGDIREEYDNRDHPNEIHKQVFFGKGKILIVGQFGACQWFGTDLDLTFKGSAIFRCIGEFDKNLSTGYFWFDPAKKNPLQVDMITVVVPEILIGPMKAIKREDFEKQKKKEQKGG